MKKYFIVNATNGIIIKPKIIGLSVKNFMRLYKTYITMHPNEIPKLLSMNENKLGLIQVLFSKVLNKLAINILNIHDVINTIKSFNTIYVLICYIGIYKSPPLGDSKAARNCFQLRQSRKSTRTTSCNFAIDLVTMPNTGLGLDVESVQIIQ